MMKWAIALTGGLCGAAIGVSIWRTFNLETRLRLDRARGMGLIFFGLMNIHHLPRLCDDLHEPAGSGKC